MRRRFENKDSESNKLRKKWLKKGFELINITSLCETRMGNSGWCNDLNEPDETCHHIQILYRNEVIAHYTPPKFEVMDDDKHIILLVNQDDPIGGEFVIYRKVKT
jgi:hypothetical protein